ncbi:MAG TPA: hypothetical protein VGN55_19525 [Xanthobacteraceae bacterium]
MPRGREHYDAGSRYEDQNAPGNMRDNVLAAIVVITLLAAGAGIADELVEGSQGCYKPDGGCGAWGIPTAEVTFEDFFQE